MLKSLAGIFSLAVAGIGATAFGALPHDFDLTPVVPGPIVSTPAVTDPAAPPPVAPAYSSLPGATASVYLDFVGETNHNWAGYDPGTTPAYDVDLDPTTFSDTEKSNIFDIWNRVSEKFSPFNLNVTTIQPTDLSKGHTLKVVIGGNGSWFGLAGGVAWPSSFSPDSGFPNTVYVFSDNLGHGRPKYVAESASHESGHGFGLQHQSVFINGNKTDEYNTGTYLRANIPNPQPGSKSPVMGNSYYADRGLWWSGTDTYNATQNDMDVIASSGGFLTNGFGYRPDDHSNSMTGAQPLAFNGTNLFGAGIIEQTSDIDFFSFAAPGGLVSFIVSPSVYGGMLDASVKLLASDGSTLVTAAITGSLSEIVTTTVPAGTYDLAVYSAGNYGDVGQYTITGAYGMVVPEPTLSAALLGMTLLLARYRRR